MFLTEGRSRPLTWDDVPLGIQEEFKVRISDAISFCNVGVGGDG